MAEEVKSADAPVQQPAKGPFVHSLRVYLVGGQQFTLNEVTDSPEVPRNVVAFINAWRAKKDVWHSPNNDVHFGVRVKDVSMYEYRVGQPAPKAEEEKVEAEVAAEAQAKAEA
ncbi:MAG: hypothetical protein ACLSU5_08885 [Sutterella wadsworthensis]